MCTRGTEKCYAAFFGCLLSFFARCRRVVKEVCLLPPHDMCFVTASFMTYCYGGECYYRSECMGKDCIERAGSTGID